MRSSQRTRAEQETVIRFDREEWTALLDTGTNAAVIPSSERFHPVHVQDAVARARPQGFRMAPCRHCGGPEVFSKRDPTRSRCFRCGTVAIAAIAKSLVSLRRCAFCGQQTMTGRPMHARFCAECARIAPKERRRRLAYRQAQVSDCP